MKAHSVNSTFRQFLFIVTPTSPSLSTHGRRISHERSAIATTAATTAKPV